MGFDPFSAQNGHFLCKIWCFVKFSPFFPLCFLAIYPFSGSKSLDGPLKRPFFGGRPQKTSKSGLVFCWSFSSRFRKSDQAFCLKMGSEKTPGGVIGIFPPFWTPIFIFYRTKGGHCIFEKWLPNRKKAILTKKWPIFRGVCTPYGKYGVFVKFSPFFPLCFLVI